MANLVPLHIDKDTGEVVATHASTIPGGGGGPSSFGYLHEQLAPALVWNIIHSAENDKLICQIYDDTGELILPDKLSIVDINTVQIEFGSPMEGRAHIMFFNTL